MTHDRKFKGTLWPTPEQRLLLRAALLGEGPAREALARWTEAVDIEDVDVGSQRLLPLLYLNLRRHGIEHPETGRLKGNYRLAWYQNQVGLRDAAFAARALSEVGVTPMLLKGAALVAGAYCDPGARPMGDTDILVPRQQLGAAVQALQGAGWAPVRYPGTHLRRAVRALHGTAFGHRARKEIDLHWFMLPECRRRGDDDRLWERAEPARMEGLAVVCPSPEDLLINVCIHGARWDPTPGVRWAADAATIIQQRPNLDWEMFTEEVIARRLSLKMADCLEYLRDELSIAVPAEAIDRLRAVRASRLERADRKAQDAPTTVPWQVTRDLLRFIRYSQGRPLPTRAQSFPTFLQEIWALESPWAVPRQGLHRVWRRSKEVGLRPWRPFSGAPPAR